ncbi:MAG: hypothetical protein Q8J97_14525, partial [Flavobacteriaceae bacterium]|nr:hypothetical protein [Flavobacteriaceae bacterium]
MACATFGLPLLVTLDVSSCDRLRAPHFVDCAALQDVSLSLCRRLTAPRFENCVSLTSLDLLECQELDEAAAAGIGQGCPLLQSLCLSRCYNVTDAAVASIDRGCPFLTLLDVSDILNLSDLSVAALSSHCKHLTTLNLRGTSIMSPDFGPLHLLTRLTVTSCQSLRTPQFFGCRDLTALNCSGCAALDDLGVISALEGSANLVELNLTMCRMLTENTISSIASQSQLTTLSLAGTPNLNDDGVKCIAEGCATLTELSLWRSHLVSDVAIQALSQCCKDLQYLYIRECCGIIAPNFSFAGLEELDVSCSGLRAPCFNCPW